MRSQFFSTGNIAATTASHQKVEVAKTGRVEKARSRLSENVSRLLITAGTTNN